MAEVMYNQDGTRIVLLNRKFDLGGRDQQELRVRFTDKGVMFFHFFQDGEPVRYGLSAAEADKFCEEWTAYKASQQTAERAEQDRIQAMIDEAYQIAAACTAIKIEQVDKAAWKVSVPAIAWGHQGPVSGAKELLELTKQAWAAYTSQMAWQAANSKATA